MPLLLLVAMAQAQTQRETETLSIQGYPGQAPVIELQGRVFVEVQELARITNGSLNFEKDRIILTLPPVGTLRRRPVMLPGNPASRAPS